MYQGLSRGDLRNLVDELHNLMIPQDPDLTVLIDLDPKLGLSRAKARNTVEERFEDFGVTLQEKMRIGFLNLAEQYANRFRVIDGLRDIDDIAADVFNVVQKHL
jgi:dTMP kinase